MNPGQGFARRVTLENLEEFSPLLKRTAESAREGTEGVDTDQANVRSANPPDPAYLAAEQLFSGVKIQVTIPFHRGRSGQQRTGTRRRGQTAQPPQHPAQTPVGGGVQPARSVRGPMVWRKVLVASDVQRQRGNPTGGARLTQARFLVQGQHINQTTYFRNDLFGGFIWTVARRRPLREEVIIDFDLTILGQHFGVQQLTVSHKPTGEGGQGNYTTILHWGDLSGQIRDLNLVRRTLTLFAPAPGTTQPFFIEITT